MKRFYNPRETLIKINIPCPLNIKININQKINFEFFHKILQENIPCQMLERKEKKIIHLNINQKITFEFFHKILQENIPCQMLERKEKKIIHFREVI